jgi:hypothetical protein
LAGTKHLEWERPRLAGCHYRPGNDSKLLIFPAPFGFRKMVGHVMKNLRIVQVEPLDTFSLNRLGNITSLRRVRAKE